MGFLSKLHKRSSPPAAPATVRCPTCGEVNAASASVCTICRGNLPAHDEQQVRSLASAP